MFGNVMTPSPVFSIQAEIEGEWQPVLKLLACRPKDSRDLPESVTSKWEPYGEGCLDESCSKCGRDIILGPRQAISYDLAPEEYVACCLMCATIISIMYSESGESISLRHIGGE